MVIKNMKMLKYEVHASKNNRYWVEILFFLVMWVIAVFNYSNADYESYRLIYDFYIPNGTGFSVMPDIGYYALCVVGRHVGLTFQIFRGVYITLALFFLVKGFSFFAKNKKNIYVLYLLFPFLIEVVQYRFFMAVAIMLYALPYLKEGCYKKYIIFVILAASQHSSALIYLLFLLCMLEEKRMKHLVGIIVIAETGVFWVAPMVLNTILGMFMPQLSMYLNSGFYTKYLYFVFLAIEVLLLVWVEKIQIKSGTLLMCFTNKLLWIALCFVPFILIDDNFVRLYRGSMPIVYSAIYFQLEKHRYVNWKNLVAIILSVLMYYVFLSQHSITNWVNVTGPIFKYNYFFELFR